MGEKVYVGGGITKTQDRCRVFRYSTSGDEWSCLPPHPMIMFAMAQFRGHLITVGGERAKGGIDITSKVYRFKEESQKWEEFLKPMPTARFDPSVATTQSAIVAIGGAIGARKGWLVEIKMSCATVEVYNSETAQWHTADPLPAPYSSMPLVVITDTCYLLGGDNDNNYPVTTVLYASLTSLVQKATSPTLQSTSHTSVWKTLPDTALKLFTPVSLSGHLVTVGGYKGNTSYTAMTFHALATMMGYTVPFVPEVHAFFPDTNFWVRLTLGDLPQSLCGCTAAQLSPNTILVIGGLDTHLNKLKTVLLATVIV